MDAFEQLVAELLERRGYWVRHSFKVELTKADKQAIGRHSSPRWEIDLLAYSGARNELLAVECKSYLDSRGVSRKGFDGTDTKRAMRYKLFNEDVLREVVFNRLAEQLASTKAVAPGTEIKLALACAKIANTQDREWLRAHFSAQQWLLLDDEQLRRDLESIATAGYENQIAAVTAKILLRKSK